MPDPVLVLGATSLVGGYLRPRLKAAGRGVLAVSRNPPAFDDEWSYADISRGPAGLPAAPAAIHLAPLWLAPPLIRNMAERGLRRLVAFGSTSRATKVDSADPKERALAARLARAEDDLRRECDAAGVAWTILRPTMIYGGGRDKNLSGVAAVARTFGVAPVAGEGRGLRQPVHADDLAALAVAALEAPSSHGRAYDVGGGTVLTYRAMLEEVCRVTGGRMVAVSPGLLKAGLRAAALLTARRDLSPAMVDRMEQDLVVDDSEARRDLGHRPRPFAYPDGGPVPPA